MPGIRVGRLGEAGELERLRRQASRYQQHTGKDHRTHQIASGWGSKADSAGTVTGSLMITTVEASGVWG